MLIRRRDVGQGGGWGCEKLAATVPCTSVYSGCIVMARIHNIIWRHTQLLPVFCKCSRTLRVLRWESYLHNIIYILVSQFHSPNSFSTMAKITPTTSLVVEVPEGSENLTQSFHQMGALRMLAILCCVLCAITPTAERLSK